MEKMAFQERVNHGDMAVHHPHFKTQVLLKSFGVNQMFQEAPVVFPSDP